VFSGVAVLIVLAPRVQQVTRPRPGWLDRRAGVATAMAALGVVVWTTGRSASVVQVALAAIGLAALALVLRAGQGAPPARIVDAPGWWVWPVVLLGGAALELADFLAQPDAQTDNLDHPTLSSVVDPLLADAWPRAVVAAAWLLIGWWLVRLATERDPGGDLP
jgi:hypothetical protein